MKKSYSVIDKFTITRYSTYLLYILWLKINKEENMYNYYNYLLLVKDIY
jgi:hypothetical protein